MLNLIEKPFYFGLGVVAYSKEKIEKAANELVKAGKIDKNDVGNFVEEILERGKDQRDEIRKILKEEIEKVALKMDIAKKSDIITDETIRKIIREELHNIMNNKK